jgi:hypothetical protein
MKKVNVFVFDQHYDALIVVFHSSSGITSGKVFALFLTGD